MDEMTVLQFWTVLSFGVVIGAAVATVITILAMSRKGDDDAPLLSVPQEDLAWSRPGDRLDAFVEGMVDPPPGPRLMRDADRRGPAAADAPTTVYEMTQRELDPARLDLEAAEQYLPGPVPEGARDTGPSHRAGELHPRIIDLGQEGDDLMLVRDWFNKRDWIASLYDPRWGGFELTESGHLVAVAA